MRSTNESVLRTLDDILHQLRLWASEISFQEPVGQGTVKSLSTTDTLTCVEFVGTDLAAKLHGVFKSLAGLVQATLMLEKRPQSHSLEIELETQADAFFPKLEVLHETKYEIIQQISQMSPAQLRESLMSPKANVARNTILSFDGGGVRSFASLLILEKLMRNIREQVNVSSYTSSEKIKPCDVFEFMFGTSSGGLISIMLGRLRMYEQEAIQQFQLHADMIFGHPVWHWPLTKGFLPKYKEKTLRDAAMHVTSTFDPYPKSSGWKRSLFVFPGEDCKIGVFAASTPEYGPTTIEPYCFRTYDGRKRTREILPATQSMIWQVARATSAHPTLFPRFAMDGNIFADGGLLCNNPSKEGYKEVRRLRTTDSNDILLISIGTGTESKKQGGQKRTAWEWLDQVRILAKLATETEKTHENME